MSTWVHRTMIVPQPYRSLAQQLCAGLAGLSGTGMFDVDLGTTPGGPITHGMSTGLIQPQFAGLMPLDEWDADAGAYTRLDPGQAETIVAGAAAAGVTLPLATVQALLAAVRVADEPWQRALAQQALHMVQPAEGNEP
jgi:hypothetical protein